MASTEYLRTHRICGDFQAKNTASTPFIYVYMVLDDPNNALPHQAPDVTEKWR